jgi:hypothetical protein
MSCKQFSPAGLGAVACRESTDFDDIELVLLLSLMIGLIVELTFRTSEGAILTFTSWANGQPNGGSPENCAGTYQYGKWYDDPCSKQRAFLCQFDAEADFGE